MSKAAYRPIQEWFKLGLLSFLGVLLVVGGLLGWLQSSSSTAFSQTSDYGLKWEVANTPTQGRVGLLLNFPSIKITNTGTQKWTSSGNDAVRLGYRWFSSDGKPVPATGETAWDDLRANLPSDIPPGGSIIFPDFKVSVPAKADNYVLHLDLAQGPTGWFATKGASDYTTKISIAPKDTTPPTASVNFLPLFQTSTVFTVTWSGADEKDGSGLATYDVQYKVFGDKEWTDWLQTTSQTGVQFSGDNGKVYLFRARASDNAGNVGQYPDNEQAFTRINILAPSSRVASLAATSPSVFLVRWSGFDSVDGSDNQLFDLQYKDGDTGSWQDWQNATPATAAVFKGLNGHTYYFRCRATNFAGLRSEYSAVAQAATTVNTVLDSAYDSSVAIASSPISTTATTTPSATISTTLLPPASPTLTATTTASATPPATATPAATTGPQTSIFPLGVKNGDNDLGTSGFVIENPGSSDLDLFVRFNDHSGAPISTTVNGVTTKTSPDQASQIARVATLLVTVPAKGTKAVWAGNLGVPNYTGWVSLSASGPFQVTAIRLPKVGLPLEYLPSNPASNLFLPYVKKAGPSGSSAINLSNPGSVPADVQISYYDTDGQLIASDKRTLPILGSTRLATFNIATGNDERFEGSAVISSSTPLVASAEVPLADGSSATYNAVPGSSAVVPQLLFYKDISNFSTALVVQNAAKDGASVKIEYFDENGVAAGNNTIVVPGLGQTVIKQQDNLKDQAHFQGYVRVSADGGQIAVLALGTTTQLQNNQQQFP
jgi:hypothetical protein